MAFLLDLHLLPTEGSRHRRRLRKVLFRRAWIAFENGLVAKSAITCPRDSARRKAQPSSLISLEMAAIRSEHPNFAMFRNCINQPFGAYDFFEIMHVLDHHSNHYFS